MTKAKMLIATVDTFTKAGRFVPRGTPLSSDEIDYHKKTSTNVTEAPAGVEDGTAVQVSAIAPTGPNPTAPQQLAPGAVQVGGDYFDRGARVVSEKTASAKERFVQIVDDKDTTQGDVQAALDKHAAEQPEVHTTAA